MSILPQLRSVAAIALTGLSLVAAGQEQAVSTTTETPASALTPKILYQFLLAEVAATQGKLLFSSAAYLDLAKTTRDPRIARRATEVAYFSHDAEIALKAARVWADIEPDTAEARQGLWALLAATNRGDELASQLVKVLAGEGSNTASSIIGVGRLASRFSDKQAALRMVQQVTAAYEAFPETYFVRAQSALAAKDGDRALASIDRALALRPDWEPAVMLKAQIVSVDTQKTLEVLSTFLARNPESRDAKLAYARVLVDAKRYADARQAFTELLNVQPDSPELLYSVGLLSMEMDDFAAGDAYLKRVLDLDFSDMDSVRYYLGHSAEKTDRVQEAIDYFDSVAARSPRYVSAQVRAASLLRQQGNFEDARRHLQQAEHAAPKERTTLIMAESQLLVESHRIEDAYKLLEAELSAHPNDTALLYESAMLAERTGRFDVLERNLHRLIKLKPDGVEAYNALGYSLADRNIRLDEAQKLIDKALAMSPDDAAILDSKGWVAFRRNDISTALEFLRKALAVNGDPEIAAHLGEVLWTQGQHDEAARVWEEALKAHPESPVLPTTIKRFKP